MEIIDIFYLSPPIRMEDWPFPDYIVNTISIGKIIKRQKRTYFQVFLNNDRYIIIRKKKWLFWLSYKALFYKWAMNGLTGSNIYDTVFLDSFEWDVDNRCEKSHNNSETWSNCELSNAAIKLIKQNGL
jgi:hypothetical protein